jgi:hypothetical protein
MESLKSYEILNEETGEAKCKYKYLEGHPKQYRFDAKDGNFNINGDKSTSFKKLVIQPISWRIFEDDILNMGKKLWAEIFFVDDKNCVSAVLFHGFSVESLYKLIEPLFYEEMTLADVILTIEAEKKENTKIQPKGIYYIASFTFEKADKNKTQELSQFAQDYKIFREETLSETCNFKTEFNYFNPHHEIAHSNNLLQ